jgi:hypothetical protein
MFVTVCGGEARANVRTEAASWEATRALPCNAASATPTAASAATSPQG